MTTAIFDADSHLMETEDWLGSFADPQVRDQLLPLTLGGAGAKADQLMSSLPKLWDAHRHQEIGPEVISGPKGWMAPGALDPDVRSRVLDALGINAQLVFPTFALVQFARSKSLDILYGGTQALNRAMTTFCAPDSRLMAVGFVPLADPERAVMALEEAIDLGVAAVWIPSEAPGDFSPAHTDLDPLWARLAEAGVPFVLHVGGGKLLPKAFHNNGLPRPATGWGVARIFEPRTFRSFTTRPNASSRVWLSMVCLSAIRRYGEPLSSWGRRGCQGCCETSITPTARFRSLNRR